MKNKGFTLIELLAVIVILAIIALIATPIILNIIGNTRNSADERSVELYKSAVEQAVTKYQLEGLVLPDGEYTISNDGKTLTNGSTVINVDYSGSGVICNSITYLDGKMNFNDCKVITSNSDNVKKYANGEVVYFDVAKGTTCANYNEDNSKTGYNGINSSGNQNSCLKFYTFNDDGGERVNLILDHNTSGLITWNSIDDNTAGPKEALEQLKIDTYMWKGTKTPTNYSVNNGVANYTINYEGYNARLITVEEIMKITGNKSFDYESEFYFDTNTDTASPTCQEGDTSGCKYGWLYDRTDVDCTTRGCLNNLTASSGTDYSLGYWTSTPVMDSSTTFCVSSYGEVDRCIILSLGYSDIRPVIEVLRSKLN